MNYNQYLLTEHWQKTRKATLAARGYQCEKCRKRGGELHVHHLTYARLGQERPEDLQVLCSECHRWEHFPMRRIEADLEKWLEDFKRGRG
jgi:5-methylcytosine-specific restriction endonuclease McrA